MSMGLCPTRASRAREPRYDWLIFKSCIREAHKCIIIFIINIIIIIIVIIIISDTSKSKL